MNTTVTLEVFHDPDGIPEVYISTGGDISIGELYCYMKMAMVTLENIDIEDADMELVLGNIKTRGVSLDDLNEHVRKQQRKESMRVIKGGGA